MNDISVEGKQQKTIYFFHFKTTQQAKFDPEDKYYCENYGQLYPYTIVYMTISNEISGEGLERLRDEVARIAGLDPKENQMLFYIESYQMSVSELIWKHTFGETVYRAFIRTLVYLKDYIEDATVFSNPIYVPYNDLKANGIVVKKCLNIRNVPKLDIHGFKGIYTIEALGMTYMVKNFSGRKNQKLICNDWFIYFSDTAFGCIKNRLFQLSGTCYLNAIVNGIILSSTVRKIALQSMGKLDVTQYSKPLNLEVCDKKDPSYLFRLIYNTICSKTPLRHSVYGQDIMVEFSKLYSSDPVGGQGGFGFQTMCKLIRLIDPDYIALGYTGNTRDEKGISRDPYPMPTSNTDELFYLKDGTGDFLVVEEGGKANNSIIYNGDTFLLQFCSIAIECDGWLPGGHEIVGIKCDNNYIIVDSHERILNLDWRKLGQDKSADERLLEYFRPYNCRRISQLFLSPLYVRASTIEKYKDVTSEELCDRLILKN